LPGVAGRRQRERHDGAGRSDAEPRAARVQAEREGRAELLSGRAFCGGRGARRDFSGERCAADERDCARSAGQRPQHQQDGELPGQRAAEQRQADQAEAGEAEQATLDTRDQRRGGDGTGEVAQAVRGVHRARLGVRPVERVPHRRQQQRVSEPAEAEAHRTGQRDRDDRRSAGHAVTWRRCAAPS
jgi:hypothetical protein